MRLLFTGDILLGRQVERQITQTGRTPWEGLQPLFRGADWLMGNLEGALGEQEGCSGKPETLCFTAPRGRAALLREAGFDALGLANNHAVDLGPEGLEATREALEGVGIAAITDRPTPQIFELGGHDLALLALSLVPDPNAPHRTLPDPEVARALRLARRLAELVVVSVHWGYELQDWPSAEQRRQARWLVGEGADLVIGHHPHVVQAPECIEGRPVFHSLGNHLFDQKYPVTKRGLLADCRIDGAGLRCGTLHTRTPLNGTFPTPADPPAGFGSPLAGCVVPLTPTAEAGGYRLRARGVGERVELQGWLGDRPVWRSPPLPLLALESGRLVAGGEELLLTLERRFSSLDGEQGVRPYVYAVTPKGLVARWRGSALAWPLIDARLLSGEPARLCALHRGDDFLRLDPGTRTTRTLVYRWNGFGFSADGDPEAAAACRGLFRDGGDVASPSSAVRE